MGWFFPLGDSRGEDCPDHDEKYERETCRELGRQGRNRHYIERITGVDDEEDDDPGILKTIFGDLFGMGEMR